MSDEPKKVLYRYDAVSTYDNGIDIYLSTYEVTKKTPKGYWILNHRYEPTFCLEGSGKRYAHETKELAFSSFKARKRMQRKIVSYQKRRADRVHNLIKDQTEPPENGDLYDGYRPQSLAVALPTS